MERRKVDKIHEERKKSVSELRERRKGSTSEGELRKVKNSGMEDQNWTRRERLGKKQNTVPLFHLCS